MPTRVQIHPTSQIAARTLAIAVVIALSLLGLKRHLYPHSGAAQQPPSASALITGTLPNDHQIGLTVATENLLVPVIDLELADAAYESAWSAALASRLTGATEVAVEGGRVDVLTKHYAVEVDRFEKWHEAIGQAAHYSLKTKKVPVVALMIPSDNWPLNEKTRTKLLLVDETCTSKGIKLILLRRKR